MDPSQSPQMAQPHNSGISFGSKPTGPMGPDPQLLSEISNVTRRVRIIEEAVSNLRKKTGIDEENNLSEIKKLHVSIKALFVEVDELKKEQSAFKVEMRRMITEFQSVAKKDEVEVLKKYIKIWEPVQFATVNQVSHMITDALEQNTHSLPIRHKHKEQAPPPKPTPVPIPPKEELPKEKPVEPEKPVTKTDEIFSPHYNMQTATQYIQKKKHDIDVETNVANQQVDISAENASAKPEVPLARKQEIAKLIENYDDVREMILNTPEEFAQQIQTEPELAALFAGVDIVALSQKLKDNYE